MFNEYVRCISCVCVDMHIMVLMLIKSFCGWFCCMIHIGTIPITLGSLTNLVSLYLSYNSLYGK